MALSGYQGCTRHSPLVLVHLLHQDQTSVPCGTLPLWSQCRQPEHVSCAACYHLVDPVILAHTHTHTKKNNKNKKHQLIITPSLDSELCLFLFTEKLQSYKAYKWKKW